SGASEVLHGLFRSPAASIRRGVVLLAADRKVSGLLPDRSVVDNATLASLERFSPRGWMLEAEARAAVAAVSERFRLRASSLDAAVATLSGGNQQKVCLARCALTRPSVLLLDEPTRGIDVAAKADVYAAMRNWA